MLPLSLCGLLSCVKDLEKMQSPRPEESTGCGSNTPSEPKRSARHLRAYEKGQRGVQAEDQLPEQTASHPRLSMRRGPGHSLERHPGFPGIGPTLQDRGTAVIMGGDWSELPITLLGVSCFHPMGELTAEGPEAAEGGRVSLKGLCELNLCSLRVDLILKIEGMLHRGYDSSWARVG